MSSGSPCGACKFLRRKCIKGCIFAPYFLSEQGTESFCAVHKVFGASNVSKLLMRIPLPEQRREAVFTIKYEAQARLKDPIYGCVGTIFTLERQVEYLQAELQFVRAQLSSQLAAAWYNHQQQQQELQPIATAPSSPVIPCGSLPLLSVNAPVGSSWCMPHITSPSSCANGARKVDESAQMSAANCILGMSNSNLEAFTSLQLLDTLQRNQLALEQRDFVNEAELQALAQALLQRN